MNLCEDNDIHFSNRQDIASEEVAEESDCVLIDHVDEVNRASEKEVVPIELWDTTTNLVGSSGVRGKGPSMLNVEESSTHTWKVIFKDDMVPEQFVTDLEHNSSREMWLGREFPNHDDFRKT